MKCAQCGSPGKDFYRTMEQRGAGDSDNEEKVDEVEEEEEDAALIECPRKINSKYYA